MLAMGGILSYASSINTTDHDIEFPLSISGLHKNNLNNFIVCEMYLAL